MKLSLFATVSASLVRRDTDVDLLGERRYFQLVKFMTFFNRDFNEGKFFAYGCNCMFVGEMPLSRTGHGQPVDALDSACKKYKDCVKCARMSHGETCIPEFVKVR